MVSCVKEVAAARGVGPNARTYTIRCYMYPGLIGNSQRPRLSANRELAAEAMTLLMRLDTELREARAEWNEDRFRRLMRLRPKAVTRLRRRWTKLNPPPCSDAGIVNLTFHDLRHTWSSRAAEMGVPEHVRRDILGHSSTSMTGDYTHASPEEMERAMEAVARYNRSLLKSSAKSRQNGIQRRSLQSAAVL